jgi:hypothetical protein
VICGIRATAPGVHPQANRGSSTALRRALTIAMRTKRNRIPGGGESAVSVTASDSFATPVNVAALRALQYRRLYLLMQHYQPQWVFPCTPAFWRLQEQNKVLLVTFSCSGQCRLARDDCAWPDVSGRAHWFRTAPSPGEPPCSDIMGTCALARRNMLAGEAGVRHNLQVAQFRAAFSGRGESPHRR